MTPSSLREIVGHLKPWVPPLILSLLDSLKRSFLFWGHLFLFLSSGVGPNIFKHPTVLFNFRPGSKLPFFSNILEKIVYNKMKAFLYKITPLRFFNLVLSLLSTKSALLRVFNDILLAIDSGNNVILVHLDSTAAFETVYHNIRVLCRHSWHSPGMVQIIPG